MKKYKYNICSKCSIIKETNRSPYCKKCLSQYHKNYRMIRKLKSNINLSGLKSFINKIQKQNNYGDSQDMLTICFFYEIITNNIHEFWDDPADIQVNKMYHTIRDFYIKESLLK